MAAADGSTSAETPDLRVQPSGRLMSLDVLRGATILGMLLVNNPGDWSYVYPPLLHAAWHRWTPTDLIFPFFVFIMGASLAFSMRKHRERVASGDRKGSGLWVRTVRRSVLLISLGLALNGFPFYELDGLRIPGVLQRLGLVYLLTVPVVVLFPAAARFVLALAVLVGWWAVLSFVPIEGQQPSMEPSRNAQRAVDLAVFGEAHVWQGAATDPEGLLGTAAAVVTCLMGYWAGAFLRDRVLSITTVLRLGIAGALLASVGEVSHLVIPINKALWTPSFVLLTGGLAMLGLALSVWVVDLRRVRWPLAPFRDVGLNPIVIFVGAGMAGRLLTLVKVGTHAEAPTVKAFAFDELVSFGLAPRFASLLIALVFVISFWLVARVLAQLKIVIRV